MMTENGSDPESGSSRLSMPLVAAGVLAGLVAIAGYIAASHESSDDVDAPKSKGSKSGGFGRKMGLMALITLIENDQTRKVVLAVLKAMARRA